MNLRPEPGSSKDFRTLLFAELIEEGIVNFVGLHGIEAQFKLLEHIDQLLPVDEFYWYYPVPRSFPPCFRREGASRDDDAFVSPTCHRASKIAHLRRSN